MIYAIQQFHATRYVTVATADSLTAAFAAAGAVKRKAPELPVRIEQTGMTTRTTKGETALTTKRTGESQTLDYGPPVTENHLYQRKETAAR